MAADVAGLTLDALLALFFMTLAAYYVLRHWEEIVRHAELLLPFAPAHTRAFMGELRAVGRSVLRGTVWTGLLQGVLAGLGFWITGVPDPAFYGALTCVASLVPAVGTLIVWVPAGAWLITTGHPAMGMAELAYGTFVIVGVVDYFVRPALIGRGSDMPAILTFIALFGGLEVFGLMGLVLGPVLVTLSVAVLRTYEAQARETAAP
jgi:predicted PurR-regulated permease PerM